MLEKLHGCKDVKHSALAHPLGEGKKFRGDSLAVVIAFTVLLLEDLDHTLGTNGGVFLVQQLIIVLGDQVVRLELGIFDRAAIAIDEFDWHVVAVLREEAYGLLARLDPLMDVPDGGTFLNEIRSPLFGQIVLAAFFLLLNHLFEFIVSEVVLGRVLVLFRDFFFAIVVLLAHVVYFIRLLHDLVAIHVVELLLCHFLETGDRLQLGCIIEAGGRLLADNFLWILDNRKRVLSQVIGVKGVEALVVLVVLPLRVGRVNRENVRSRPDRLLFLRNGQC